MFKGIDVSEHNGVIDWAKVKAGGIGFAMIRAGYGSGTIDKRFVQNITACNKLGIPCGVYWFSYALNASSAAKEAQACLAAIKPYTVTFPVAYDLEYDSVSYAKQRGVIITKTLASSFASVFLTAVEQAGYHPMLYANPDYLANYFTAEVASRFDLWLACWNKATNPPRSCAIWQHAIGSAHGVTGDVDLNRSYKDYTPSQTPAWNVSARQWVMDNEISDGTNPTDGATREQIWAMLERYHERFHT